MDDFGKFVYLDVEKTGSTYISAFLEQHANLQRKKFKKHARVTDDYDPQALYFISARHPFEQYQSLYQHGYGRKGLLQQRLRQLGRGDLYTDGAAGFSKWLEFILDEENASYLGRPYQRVNNQLIGYQTFRFLRLSLRRPIGVMAKVRSIDELRDEYRRTKIHNHIIRNEALNSDLLSLIEVQLSEYFNDMETIRKALEKPERKTNASDDLNISEDCLTPSLRDLLYRKEAFLLQELYPPTP